MGGDKSIHPKLGVTEPLGQARRRQRKRI